MTDQKPALDHVAVPVVTRAGAGDAGTGRSGGAVRHSGVSPQHTPATRRWCGTVSNEPGVGGADDPPSRKGW